jgi:branched-chain amino acid transport system substrate-binding protein
MALKFGPPRRLTSWALAFMLAAAPAGARELKIGFIGPLSGSAAVYGTEPLRGIEAALGEIEASGVLKGDHIKLIPADTGANPAAAAQAVSRMIDSDEVLAVIGGCTSAETAAAIEITRAAGVLQISPLAQDAALTQENNPWFARIAQTTVVFAQGAARWSIERHQAKRVYILARNDNYGISLADAFEADIKNRGGAVAGRVAYEPNAKEFKPILARLAEAKPDLVAIMGFYTDTGLIMKQMAELQIALPTFANTSPAVPQFREIAGPGAEGAYGALYYFAGSIDSERGQAFVKAWNARYSRLPSQYEGMGYDVAYVLVEAIRRAASSGPVTSKSIRDALLTIKDFPGATGAITMLPNGDVQRPLPFVQLVGGTLKLDTLLQ